MRVVVLAILLSFGLVQMANSAFEKIETEPVVTEVELIEEGSLKKFIMSEDLSKLSQKEINKAREQLAIAISTCKSKNKNQADETCKALWDAVHL